jgi:thymidine kinase
MMKPQVVKVKQEKKVIGNYPAGSGAIEVVCGPMFSGKTEELIRRVKRAQIARQKVQIFKPSLDTRYHETDVVSHSSLQVEAVPILDAVDILRKLLDSTRVVAIDEVQFLDETVVRVVTKLARRGIRVICAGLDQDYRGRPFGPMPALLAIADKVDKVQAVCTVCGMPATKTYRKDLLDTQQVIVGEADKYEARCRAHVEYDDEIEQDALAFTLPMQEPNEAESLR